MFDNERVLQALKALDIAQIAVDLGRSPNRQNFINCTFHNEKTPSLKLYPNKGTFNCFGCGKHGSTIDLYMSTGLSFADAVKEMKTRYLGISDGSSLVAHRLTGQVVDRPKQAIIPLDEFSQIYADLQAFCRQHIPTAIKWDALDYLKRRAFEVEIIQQFGLFVIPDAKRVLDFLTSTYTQSVLEASGLISPKGWFVFTKHPLIIPYLDKGKIVNLQGRCISNSPSDRPKYLYLRGRPPVTMFNGDVLRGLPTGSKIYMTEGAFDTIAITQKGGVGVSMNSVTLFQREWVPLFKGLEVIFILDNDKAGQEAINRWAPVFRQACIRVFSKRLPDGCKDVNDWLIKWSGHANGYPAFWDQ